MWIVLITVVVIFAIVIHFNKVDPTPTTNTNEAITSHQATSYKGGHPLLDNEVSPVYLNLKEDKIEISTNSFGWSGTAAINYIFIKNITVEDATTFEKRVTLGRVLLVGVFALAWRKNQKKDAAYLVIEWSDGRFEHQTVFDYEGAGSLNRANTVRNAIIKKVTAFEISKNESN